MSTAKMGAGSRRIADARRKQREAMDKLVAELRVKEAAEGENAETEASPYRQAEEIARNVHQRR